MGLTRIKVKDYWIASQLGMLPGTLVNLYLGSKLPPLSELIENGIPTLLTPPILLGFTLLAIVPVGIRLPYDEGLQTMILPNNNPEVYLRQIILITNFKGKAS